MLLVFLLSLVLAAKRRAPDTDIRGDEKRQKALDGSVRPTNFLDKYRPFDAIEWTVEFCEKSLLGQTKDWNDQEVAWLWMHCGKVPGIEESEVIQNFVKLSVDLGSCLVRMLSHGEPGPLLTQAVKDNLLRIKLLKYYQFYRDRVARKAVENNFPDPNDRLLKANQLDEEMMQVISKLPNDALDTHPHLVKLIASTFSPHSGYYPFPWLAVKPHIFTSGSPEIFRVELLCMVKQDKIRVFQYLEQVPWMHQKRVEEYQVFLEICQAHGLHGYEWAQKHFTPDDMKVLDVAKDKASEAQLDAAYGVISFPDEVGFLDFRAIFQFLHFCLRHCPHWKGTIVAPRHWSLYAVEHPEDAHKIPFPHPMPPIDQLILRDVSYLPGWEAVLEALVQAYGFEQLFEAIDTNNYPPELIAKFLKVFRR